MCPFPQYYRTHGTCYRKNTAYLFKNFPITAIITAVTAEKPWYQLLCHSLQSSPTSRVSTDNHCWVGIRNSPQLWLTLMWYSSLSRNQKPPVNNSAVPAAMTSVALEAPTAAAASASDDRCEVCVWMTTLLYFILIIWWCNERTNTAYHYTEILACQSPCNTYKTTDRAG